VNNIFQDLKINPPKTEALPREVASVLEEEHAQLKQEQAVHQDIINLLKDKNPELYNSIMQEV
jgi:hypothetical protein